MRTEKCRPSINIFMRSCFPRCFRRKGDDAVVSKGVYPIMSTSSDEARGENKIRTVRILSDRLAPPRSQCVTHIRSVVNRSESKVLLESRNQSRSNQWLNVLLSNGGWRRVRQKSKAIVGLSSFVGVRSGSSPKG
jgi:hypothetical protein